MIKTVMFATILAFSLGHGHCQDLGKASAFEVASITPCKPGTPENPGEHAGMVQYTFPGGRFRASATTLKFLLEWAYTIQPSQHSGGPSWMDTDRYDVVAKAEGNATDDQQKQMLRTLLADRFELKFHSEKKKMPAYVISLGKNAPKLFAPKEDEIHGIHITQQKEPDQKVPTYHVACTRFTLGQLTDTFARVMGRVFVNETGYDGEFDFTLDLAPDESDPNPLDPTLLIRALREQIGLTLKSQEAVVDYFVIDNATKVVAGN